MAKKENKLTVFEFFRFQLHPFRNQQLRLELFGDEYNKLIQNKNTVFSFFMLENFGKARRLPHIGGSSITIKLIEVVDDNYVFVLNVKRKIRITNENFKEEELEDYPAVIFVVNNESSVQSIAIERNYKAFSDVKTVADILQSAFARNLRGYGLSLYIKPIYSKDEFWSVAEMYKDKITQIKFELVRPNMSNISGAIDEDLKQLQRETDTHQADITLKSAKDSTLSVSEENKQLSGLVNYAANGGGNIKMRIKGFRAVVSTKEKNLEVAVEEFEAENFNSNTASELFGVLKVDDNGTA